MFFGKKYNNKDETYVRNKVFEKENYRFFWFRRFLKNKKLMKNKSSKVLCINSRFSLNTYKLLKFLNQTKQMNYIFRYNKKRSFNYRKCSFETVFIFDEKSNLSEDMEISIKNYHESTSYNALIKKMSEIQNYDINVLHEETENQASSEFNSALNFVRITINKKVFSSRTKLEEVFNKINHLLNIYESNMNDYDAKITFFEMQNGKNPSMHYPYDRLEVSSDTMVDLNLSEKAYVTITNCMNGISYRCSVYENNKLQSNEILILNKVRKKLEMRDTENYVIGVQKERYIKSSNIVTQDRTIITKNKIIVSSDLYDALGNQHSCELVNLVTGTSMNINKDDVEVKGHLNSGTIQLNYLQRQFLDFELPPDQITSFYYNEFLESSVLSKEEIDLIASYYSNEKVIGNLSFEAKTEVKKILRKPKYFTLAIYPTNMVTKPQKNILRSISDKMLRIIIGNKTLKLRTIRPYSSDESDFVVRLSSNAMKLLGVEETENVIIKYQGKSFKARALNIDSQDLIKETNILTNNSDINISIGIPAHIRGELDIMHIGKVCEVERDMLDLFNKNLNIQFLPIIAVLFTVLSTINDPLTRVLLIIFLIPISLYMTLSRVREKIEH